MPGRYQAGRTWAVRLMTSLPSATGPPASSYQEKVTLHGVTAPEGDLEHGAFAEEGVGGVHYVIFQAQALVHLPQVL